MTEPTIDATTFAELQDAAGSDFVAELVGTFLEEAPLMLAELRNSHAGPNPDVFRRAAHSLKSNAHTFGATRLASLARHLELGGLLTDTAPLDVLEAEYRKVAAALQDLCNG